MNFYDDQSMTTRELFERFFPGREDVIRLLMEPITYANGSTLEDPAISYGIVFSNFMSKGVFTFEGGTDRLIGLMEAELREERRRYLHQVRRRRRSIVEGGRVRGVEVNGRTIRTRRGHVERESRRRRFSIWSAKSISTASSSTTPGPCG